MNIILENEVVQNMNNEIDILNPNHSNYYNTSLLNEADSVYEGYR